MGQDTGKQEEEQPSLSTLAKQYQLGKMELEHHEKPHVWYTCATLCVALCIGAIAMIFAAASQGVFWIVASVVLLALTAWCIANARHYRGPECLICADGLIYRDVKQKKLEIIYWKNVVAVREIFTLYTSSSKNGQSTYFVQTQYTLQMKDGYIFTLTHGLGKYGILQGPIEKHCVNLLLPEALKAYDAGLPVRFGAIEVSKQGITSHNNGQTLPWNELLNVMIGLGALIIKKRKTPYSGDEWEKIYISGMPNLAVFSALVKHVTGSMKVLYI